MKITWCAHYFHTARSHFYGAISVLWESAQSKMLRLYTRRCCFCWFAWQWLHKHVFCTQHTLRRRRLAQRLGPAKYRENMKITLLYTNEKHHLKFISTFVCCARKLYTPAVKEAEWKAPNSDSNYPFPFFTRCLFFGDIFPGGRGTDLCLLHTTRPRIFPSLQFGLRTHFRKSIAHMPISHAQQQHFF